MLKLSYFELLSKFFVVGKVIFGGSKFSFICFKSSFLTRYDNIANMQLDICMADLIITQL